MPPELAAKAAAEESENDNDLLKDLNVEDEGEEEGTEEAGGEGEEADSEGEVPSAEDLNTSISNIQQQIQEKGEAIEQAREDNVFLSKQLTAPDASQFEKGGLFEDLEPLMLGNISLYMATEAQVNLAVRQIEASEELSTSRKNELLRKIDRALAVYEDRKKQYDKQIKSNMENLNVQEWQQVEAGFKDPENGIKGIDKHIPEIWEWCKAQMNARPSLKAKCDASLKEKIDLATRAIRVLGIDKKLIKDLPAEGRPGLDVPVGQSGSRGTGKGAGKAPTYTRAQLQKLLARPEKVDDRTMASINKAMAEGRIKDK